MTQERFDIRRTPPYYTDTIPYRFLAMKRNHLPATVAPGTRLRARAGLFAIRLLLILILPLFASTFFLRALPPSIELHTQPCGHFAVRHSLGLRWPSSPLSSSRQILRVPLLSAYPHELTHTHTLSHHRQAPSSRRAAAIASSSATAGPGAPTARSTSASTTAPARRACRPPPRPTRSKTPSARS